MGRPVFDRPIAHRGLHDLAHGIVENSRSAFEAAISAGYAIECDVQLSKDGEPFIFHDDTLERLTAATGPSDSLPIAEVTQLKLTGSDAGERPQRFAEFLAQVGGRTLLQIELKKQPNAQRTQMLARAIAEALKGHAGPYVLESFDPRLISALRRAGVAAPIGIVTYDYRDVAWDRDISPFQRFVLRHLLHWPWTRFDFISCQDSSLSLPAVRLFRSSGMPVTAWTILSPDQARSALNGSDQIVFEGFRP